MRKKDIFFKTKRKVTVLSTVIVFLCLLIFAIITKTLYTSIVFSHIDKQLMDERNSYINVVNGGRDGRDWRGIPKLPPNIIMVVQGGNGVALVNQNYYFDSENLPDFPENSEDKIVTFTSGAYTFRGIKFQFNDLKISLIINVDSEIQSVNQLMSSIVLSFIILIIIALILSYYLSSKIMKPVKEAYDKQVFFVQDASHEMRTPLAVIRGKLELLANKWGDTVGNNFDHISKMMSEVRGLEKLNSDLLLLSKEDVDGSVNITEFSLDEFIEDVSEFYVDLAEIQEKSFDITINLDANIKVNWDYNKIKRMIIILIENAFKYTKENGSIQLIFEDVGKNIKVTVKDNGIGIKEDEQERIFDRFFRSADVRVKSISGSGIGLSLLKSIAKTLDIKVKLTSKVAEGTEFNLLIPKIIK
ncbi:Signal transduction histidine-protein kinase ArlS [uncultured Clostridium sp.]|uniref:sensor histidine kinase n=1 Tax=uncultured Clostridium sp. TaxID=59620 RepID=UPI0008225A0F|nr:HAMP domain-containing sensor histidine kinase [uncultured Clostridium sp.]SCJ63416.1 Signal transduction histidine-protein kinase ArlS [uncultured Clostridium sp.]